MNQPNINLFTYIPFSSTSVDVTYSYFAICVELVSATHIRRFDPLSTVIDNPACVPAAEFYGSPYLEGQVGNRMAKVKSITQDAIPLPITPGIV